MPADNIEVRTVLLTVKRKTNTIPEVALSYEVPILQALHGEDVVQILDLEYDTLLVANDALSEHQRIVNKYGEKGLKVVQAIYPTAAVFSEASGLAHRVKGLGEVTEKADQSLQKDPAREARKKAAKKGEKAA
jgi:tryptophan synthase alpha subunit